MKSDFSRVVLGCELRWDQVKQRIALWRRVARSRRELSTLSDRTLQDIGLNETRIVDRIAGAARPKSPL